MKKGGRRERLGIPYCTEHQIWIQMWNRCRDPKDKAYSRYGLVGICVCERWIDFFMFFEDMGRRPSNRHSLDRKNGKGNYEPSNCRWATLEEQAGNRSNCLQFTIDGKTQAFAAWCRHFGVSKDRCLRRLHECGGDLLKAVELAKSNRTEERKLKITIHGETRSLQGWAKFCGIKAKVIWQRITRDGRTPEEAISLDPHYLNHPRVIRITLNGTTDSLVGWCRRTGIPRTTAMRRYKRTNDWSKVFPVENT